MKSVLFLVVLFLAMDVLRSEECRCAFPHSHPQDMFCSSDYVIRALVQAGPREETLLIPRLSVPSTPWSRQVLVYTVELKAVFKGSKVIKATTELQDSSEELSLPMEIQIFTDNNACAAKLHAGLEYVLAGYSDKERLEIFSCSWFRPWDSLSRSQQLGVRRYYGKNCECRTSLCSLLDPLGGIVNFECGEKHLYCDLRRDGATCKWRSVGRWYRKCVEDTEVLGWYLL